MPDDNTNNNPKQKLANFTVHVMRPLNTYDLDGGDMQIIKNRNLGVALQIILPSEERTTGTTIFVADPGPASRTVTSIKEVKGRRLLAESEGG